VPQEAAQLFEMIKGNFLLSQVLFELARDMPNSHGAAPLHPLSIADILRHTRLGDGDRLVDCFTAINQAFQVILNDSQATLFGFDQYGHVFIHETTHARIRKLWERMFAAHAPSVTGPALGEVARTHPRANRGNRSPPDGFGPCRFLTNSCGDIP
jgi:hypothetical protein